MTPRQKETVYGLLVVFIVLLMALIGGALTDTPVLEYDVRTGECVQIINGPGYTCDNYPEDFKYTPVPTRYPND